MQTTLSKTTKSKTKDKNKDDTLKKTQEEKQRKTITISTPRNYVQKSTTSDIYGSTKKVTPKPLHRSGLITTRPTKDLLKSTSSSTLRSRHETPRSTDKKDSIGTSKTLTSKSLPFSNVTVQSPIEKRKLDPKKMSGSKEKTNYEKRTPKAETKVSMADKSKSNSMMTERVRSAANGERGRTSTRTLEENEVKVLTPDVVDNNAEMLNLTQKLKAKPKAFYVDLETDKATEITKESEEEVSYEDDFESYESDFESYHSDGSDKSVKPLSDENEEAIEIESSTTENHAEDYNPRFVRDEENMLDSGNFDLRESQRSANKCKPAVMEFILEGTEKDIDEKKTPSFTDEGFQEMSSSSATSSMKTTLFIDFAKAKEKKRRRKNNDRLRNRAKDLLGIITLHEMYFTLFEMKPIAYDVYMATFGRSNYTQMAIQTNDDSVEEETQTDDVPSDHKWTQHPVKFSKSDIYLYSNNTLKKRRESHNLIDKFSLLFDKNYSVDITNEIDANKDYINNPLRVFLEQKNGFGATKMLPYTTYKQELKTTDHDVNKLNKFLKKFEGKVTNILSLNNGKSDAIDLNKKTKIAFSKGYVALTTKNVVNEKFSILKETEISGIILSGDRNSHVVMFHRRCNTVGEKCLVSVWDVNVTTEPVKILIAINDVNIGKYRANSGIFIASLDDGSIHLWDLTEAPNWQEDYGKSEPGIVEVESEKLTQIEIDREWNVKNRDTGYEQANKICTLQSCSYTSSAINMISHSIVDKVVGLEFVGDTKGAVSQDDGRKLMGQICSLQRIGVLTLWSIIQDRSKTHDIGKAFWSVLKLEKSQIVNLNDHIDLPTSLDSNDYNFNLNAAKRRLLVKKQERQMRKDIARPKSAVDDNRPASAAVSRNKAVTEYRGMNGTDIGIVCNDLKITKLNNIDNYLVALNCGDVICCTRSFGAVKVKRLFVTNDTSPVTSIDVSPHGLPYFLAATDSGTINLCSIIESRVLLTLDCRNAQGEPVEKCQADHKGRYIGSVAVKPPIVNVSRFANMESIKMVLWSRVNPCCIFAVLQNGTVATWDLTSSDISAKSCHEKVALAAVAGDEVLALLTTQGEVQIHRLANEERKTDYLNIFQKYVSLL